MKEEWMFIKLIMLQFFVGKTDNSDALTSVLNENDFYALFIGTQGLMKNID